MNEKLPLRNEVPSVQTWDLTDIFKTEEDYQNALQQFQQLAKAFVEDYEGKMKDFTTVEQLVKVIQQFEDILTLYMQAMSYAYLDAQTEMTNGTKQSRLGTVSMIGSQVMASLSFFESDLALLSDEYLEEVAANSDYSFFIKEVIKNKPYQLAPESEKVLKALGPVLDLPDNGYNITKLSDMQFETFKVDGKQYPLSFVQFENHYQTETDTDVRRAAFKQFSADLRKYQNTIANYYNTQVKKEKILANLRGFNSVFDYLLNSQNVSLELYNRQIDVLMEELSIHMRKYAEKLKEKLGVETLYYSDLKAPFLADEQRSIDYMDACNLVVNALSVLGNEYREVVESSLDERWIDWAGNVGKSTGGFCSSIYGVHPYILLSWNSSLSEVFTLAHEIGHAVQSVFTHRRYPRPLQTQSSRYTIEAPSTFNEMLLSNHLLSENPDDEKLAQWVAVSMIENTYYHNFVTHFLEAAFQREVYQLVDKGVDLQAEDFNRIFKEQLEKFWGDSVVLDEGAELTWMRQPHYYMGLYSYTYSAGLTISTVMSQRVASGDQKEIDKWLNALSETESQHPLEFAQLLDIDLTTDQPLKETVAYIGSLIDSL